jgi:hypothetical protein
MGHPAIVRQSNSIQGANNVAKMTQQQKLEYKMYRAECRIRNVEPVRADFLMGEIPSCVAYQLVLEQNELEWERRKVMAATAGR